MYAEVAWVLVSSGTQVQPQVTLDPGYLPDYLSISYDYGLRNIFKEKVQLRINFFLKKKTYVRSVFPASEN